MSDGAGRCGGSGHPSRYSKGRGAGHGWHGGGLCRCGAAIVIGGDVFGISAGNCRGPGPVYHEANLDTAAAQRGRNG